MCDYVLRAYSCARVYMRASAPSARRGAARQICTLNFLSIKALKYTLRRIQSIMKPHKNCTRFFPLAPFDGIPFDSFALRCFMYHSVNRCAETKRPSNDANCSRCIIYETLSLARNREPKPAMNQLRVITNSVSLYSVAKRKLSE